MKERNEWERRRDEEDERRRQQAEWYRSLLSLDPMQARWLAEYDLGESTR
jgi:hypothetical protein